MKESQSYITNSTHIHKHILIGRACSAYGGGVYRVLVEILERKRQLRRSRRRWEDNFKVDLQEVGCGDMDWIEDRDRWQALVNAVIKRQVLYTREIS
jgi:hypothetical protein